MPLDPEEALRTGDLDAALKAIKEKIRARPENHEHRLFLFQLLSVMGDIDRALTHLNVAADLDDDAEMMAKMYRAGLACESFRHDVFLGKKTPLIFGEPEPWIGPLLQASQYAAAGEMDAAISSRDQAFEAVEAVSGQINDEPFEWVMDADSRLGPVLEMIINGKYYWVPFHRIKELKIDKPQFLKDMVWLSAEVVWANRGQASVLIPVRYAGSTETAVHELLLARRTDWSTPAEGYYTGLGQRMLSTDTKDVPLLEVRSLIMDVPDVEFSADDIAALAADVVGDAGLPPAESDDHG